VDYNCTLQDEPSTIVVLASVLNELKYPNLSELIMNVGTKTTKHIDELASFCIIESKRQNSKTAMEWLDFGGLFLNEQGGSQ
jgi:hypothetical protein